MTGYFDRLGEELRLATEARYGPADTRTSAAANAHNRRSRSRTRGRARRLSLGRSSRWPRLGVLAFVAVGASAGAAAIPLLDGSHGLAGRVPKAALALPGRIVGYPAGLSQLASGVRYAIPVTPDLEAGDAGWCSYPAFFLLRSAQPLPGAGGECGPASPGSLTIIAGGEPLTNVFSELATEWRAVVTFTRGPMTTLRFLDHRGHPINQPEVQPARPVPVTTVSPRRVPNSVCGLGSSDLPGLDSEWEVVANAAPRRGALVDRDVLFSCARAWYAFPRSQAVYSAAILLSAQNPARRAPNLPGLTPGIRPGDYEEAAATAGQITARRIGNAWLLVQGPRQQLRDALLHDISATGTALRR
ncbi:MAG: hypothetical protein ACR2LV_08840 [Solirubrobacteraceae bacterium]